MHRPSTLAAIGILTFAMAACGSEPEEETSSSSPPANPPVIETQSAAKPFEKPPTVPQKSVTSTASAAGLIQSTNPSQRAKQVQKGRPDPFAAIFAPVVVKAPPTPASPKPASPAPPVARAPQPVPAPPPSSLPPVVAAPPVEPPRPDIASGIAVSGVVQIGEELQAIVQVPNEGISRYVRQGQLLSNGQVLVKQIELTQGAEPVIILEQNGIEVAKSVGEQPASEQQGSPAADTAAPADNNTEPPTNNAPAVPGSIRRGPSSGQPTNITNPPVSEPPAGAPSNISPPPPSLVPATPTNEFDDAGEGEEDESANPEE